MLVEFKEINGDSIFINPLKVRCVETRPSSAVINVEGTELYVVEKPYEVSNKISQALIELYENRSVKLTKLK